MCICLCVWVHIIVSRWACLLYRFMTPFANHIWCLDHLDELTHLSCISRPTKMSKMTNTFYVLLMLLCSGSSLLVSEGTERHEVVKVVACGSRQGGRGQETMWTHRPSCTCSPPLPSVSATSLRAHHCCVLSTWAGMSRSRRLEGAAVEVEQSRGHKR